MLEGCRVASDRRRARPLIADPKEEEMSQAAVAANAALVLRLAGPRTVTGLPHLRIEG